MKIEIRSNGEVHISGYVNAVERDSRMLLPQMAAGAAGFVRFVLYVNKKQSRALIMSVRLCLNLVTHPGIEPGTP